MWKTITRELQLLDEENRKLKQKYEESEQESIVKRKEVKKRKFVK